MNIDARRAVVIGSLRSEAWVPSAMSCRGAIAPQGNDCSMAHSGVCILASESCLARTDDCQAGNGTGEIGSQRVMGPLHASCVTEFETSFHETERTEVLASRGRGLLAAFGSIPSPLPSARTFFPYTSGVAGSSERQLFFPGGVQNSKRKKMVFEKSPLPDSNFLTITSTMGISPKISSATGPSMREHHEGSKTCPMHPKELWQVLYESCFAVSNSSTEHSAVSLSSTSASSDGAIIHTSHNNEEACDCTPTGQETSAVSPPRDSPFNDANNSRS